MATTNIGLPTFGELDNPNVVLFNSIWNLIDTAIGALGTPSATNNLVALIGKENYGSTVGSGSSFTEALRAVTYTPYYNATQEVRTTVENAVEAIAAAVEALSGSGTFLAEATAQTGAGATQRVGALAVRSSANLYHGLMLSTSTGLAVQFRKISASSYHVKIDR